MRREIPLVITFVVGVVFVISYFIPHYPFNEFESWFTDWFSIVGAFAIWLGALNLMKISTLKIVKQKKDWPFSALTIVSFLIIVIFGFYGGKGFRDPGTTFDWLYVYVYTALSSTMFALLAFFVASASYRAFRARNFEATLLLVAAFFVMLGRVPVGDMITGFLPLEYQMSHWANWVMNILNTAGQRAIMIGIALGLVSTSLRVILGLERSYLGGD
ncbi:MAG: hypothetical protein KAR42_02430 [candidate division Zixibacteria bacterium]|nr:hypothetical protein [candidate division Zixibacteria bacterium]